MTKQFSFFIPGDPLAQPRQQHRVVGRGPKAFVQNFIPAKHPIQGWKARVTLLATEAGGSLFFAKGEPVTMRLFFLFNRPKSHFKKSGDLTKSAPRFKTSKPDLDNLEKSIKDALNGVIWHDDSQVTSVRKDKLWVNDHPGVFVVIAPDDRNTLDLIRDVRQTIMRQETGLCDS